jgi:hypothetical protein
MQYEYVNVKLDNFAPGSSKSHEHRQNIDQYAARGFRYVGFVPCQFGPSGKMISMDLIFEAPEA